MNDFPDTIKTAGGLLRPMAEHDLERGIKLGGYLNLTDTPLKTLPAKLRVKGDLSLIRYTTRVQWTTVGETAILGKSTSDFATIESYLTLR